MRKELRGNRNGWLGSSLPAVQRSGDTLLSVEDGGVSGRGTPYTYLSPKACFSYVAIWASKATCIGFIALKLIRITIIINTEHPSSYQHCFCAHNIITIMPFHCSSPYVSALHLNDSAAIVL